MVNHLISTHRISLTSLCLKHFYQSEIILLQQWSWCCMKFCFFKVNFMFNTPAKTNLVHKTEQHITMSIVTKMLLVIFVPF